MDNPFKNYPPVDVDVIPDCAREDTSTRFDLKEMADSFNKSWKKELVINIEYVTEQLCLFAMINSSDMGQRLLTCRMEINRRNWAIRELRNALKQIQDEGDAHSNAIATAALPPKVATTDSSSVH